jgi:hypothetical protein
MSLVGVYTVQSVRLNSPVPSDLTSIPAHAFRGLSNLVEIELSHGKINNLDTESFSGTSLLFFVFTLLLFPVNYMFGGRFFRDPQVLCEFFRDPFIIHFETIVKSL